MKSLLLKSLIAFTLIAASAAPQSVAAGRGKLIERSALDNVPRISETVDGYTNPDSVIDRLAELPLHSVEGLWRFATEGSLMAIERCAGPEASSTEAGATVYRMVAVRAADLSLRPGTVMGYLTPTAKRGVYDARIYSGRHTDGTSLSSPATYTLSLNDSDSRLAISGYGSSLRFNWWKLLPYMYRHIFSRKEKSPGEIHGCVRVYPLPAVPTEPRYL